MVAHAVRLLAFPYVCCQCCHLCMIELRAGLLITGSGGHREGWPEAKQVLTLEASFCVTI